MHEIVIFCMLEPLKGKFKLFVIIRNSYKVGQIHYAMIRISLRIVAAIF